MSVPLYMDHHVNSAITNALRDREVDVITTADDGAEEQDDEEIMKRASQLGRAVFTQDDDFLVVADDWMERGQEFAGLIYAHQLRITIAQAIRDLELIAKVMNPDEMRNRIEFLPYS
jgi:predicted nuclease of predicted toxin-antitoxin system